MVSLPTRNARRAVYFTSLDCSLQEETETSDSKGSWPERGSFTLASYARDVLREEE